jgi:hypothetical protein
MPNEKINNVCNCYCHTMGKAKCTRCAVFHRGKEPVATHENDKQNPDIQ